MRAVLAAILALCCTLFASPALAGGDALRPGQFVWYDQPRLIKASTAPSRISVTVSLADQRAYVYRDGEIVGVTTVSTGTPGKATPVGNYTILQKKVFHRSNLYSNAPMPFMQRLTWSGIAMHAGHLPGYPASHGCIRMPRAFAEQLYGLTDLGVSVSVVAHSIKGVPNLPAPQIAAAKRGRPAKDDSVEIDLDPIPYPTPMIVADVSALHGEAFAFVTMSGDPPETFEASPAGK